MVVGIIGAPSMERIYGLNQVCYLHGVILHVHELLVWDGDVLWSIVTLAYIYECVVSCLLFV